MRFNLMTSVGIACFHNLSANWTSVSPMNNMLCFNMFITVILFWCLVTTIIAMPQSSILVHFLINSIFNV